MIVCCLLGGRLCKFWFGGKVANARNKKKLLSPYSSTSLKPCFCRSLCDSLASGMESIPAKYNFSRYRISAKLGAGGMGEVFLAEDLELDRKVALKILSSRSLNNDEGIRRFIQEAKAVSALNHPNILTVYEIGRSDDSHFIATEYINGKNLRERLRSGPIPVQESIETALQIAAALNAAHASGIIHRDIKPENVMRREDGLVKVLDFGLAKLSEKISSLTEPEAVTLVQVKTESGMLLGTTAYMSPEQARGKRTDERTDIWSFGVVLYEMLAGIRPFEGETTSDVIASILKSEPADIDRPGQEIPPELQRIVRKTLQKKPDERYQTVKDLMLDLQNLKSEQDFTLRLERSHIPSLAKTSATEEAASDRTSLTTQPIENFDSETQQSRTWTNTTFTGAGKKNKVFVAVLAGLIAALGLGVYFIFLRVSADVPIESIAVLPFQNGSGDAGLDYISDGISEGLIDSLTLLPELKVIARNSSFKLRGHDDLQAAAKLLGARAIVTGRFEQRGNSMVVRVEVVDTYNNRQIWSQVYDRTPAEAQAVQKEISLQITERLQLKTGSEGQTQMAKQALVKPEAYENLLKGRFAVRQYTPESTLKAVEFYEAAIREDALYALAFAELAYTLRLIGASAFLDPGETNPKAQRAALRALEIDESSGLAHLVLAEIRRDQWDWQGADALYRRSIELNPNLAEAHEGYAVYLSVLQKHEQSIAAMRRAKDLDPLRLLTQISMGAVFYNARRGDDALAVLENALDLEPNSPITHTWIGIVQASQKSYLKAITSYDQAFKLGDDTTATQCYYGHALAMSGRRDEALAIISRFQAGTEFVSPVSLAILYTGMGDKPQALDALERAFESRDPQLQYLNVETHFDNLRVEPRFKNLLQRVGL